MISKEELKEYALTKKLNLGQAEINYFQNIILFILYQNFGKELVFKGGTALNIVYGLPRFSEDLDFTLSKEIDIKDIVQHGLNRFYLESEITEKRNKNSFNYIIRIKGPLYIGIKESLCRIELDFSLREKVCLEPKISTIGRLLLELPQFDVIVMNPKEILAEKVRAIITRKKARDVYDLWFLIEMGTNIDFDLIAEKLRYYEKKYSFSDFKRNLNLKKDIWESELKPLLKIVPPIEEKINIILKKFRK